MLRSPPRIIFSSPVFKCAYCHSSPVFKCAYCHSSPTPHILPPPVNEEEQPEENEDRNRNRKSNKSSKTITARTLARLINKQPWSPELETSLSPFSSHLSKTTVLQSLRLIQTPDKSFKFFNWSTNQGFIHNDQTYFVLLETLGRSGNLNAARNLLFSIEKKSKGNVKLQDKFFNSLIRSYAEAGLFQEALKVFPTMKSIGVSPSVITFNSLLSVLLRRGRTNMAKKLYEEMLFTGGASPDLYTFNILIRGFCMNSMVDDGFRIFKEMPRLGCEPDVITYNTLMDGLCRAGKVRIAHNLLKGMSRKSSDLNPNVVSYTTLIRGYCKKQEISDALEVFEEMISCGLRPNDITYNTLIQGLCEAQMIDKMKEILEGAIKVGSFVPDTCTFNTMMNSQCNAGKLEDALKVFEKFSELKVQPDSASYSILIRSLCQKREFERAERLIDELLEKEILLRDDGCKRIVAAYNPIFGYLCEKGRTRKADKLFKQLLRRGTHDPSSFKTLIMGHCKEGTFEGGFNLLVLMLRRDLMPDLEIYESLLDGFLKKNESAFAHKTLEKMLKSSYQSNTSTFHTVLMELVKAGSAQEAASLIKLMLEKRIRQNINISTDALILFFKSGLKDTAFEIVGLLYENGYSIKMDELIGFLCEKKKFPEAREIVLFCLEKNESIDVEVYSSVITGLCKAKQAAEAFSLYYESTEKGSQPSLSCLKDLKMTLESERKSNEAEFVSKRLERSMNQEKK